LTKVSALASTSGVWPFGVLAHGLDGRDERVGGNGIGKTERDGFARLHRASCSDEVDGGYRADQARQALRRAGARDNAEFHVRQAESGILAGDTAMASATSQPPPSAAPCTAQKNRFFEALEALDAVVDVGKCGLDRWFAELLDVSPVDEGAAGAGDDDAGDIRRGCGMIQRCDEAGPHMCRKGVDGGIVDRDDEHALVKTGGNALRKTHLGHFRKPHRGMTAVA
jgi:hypothetical protein